MKHDRTQAVRADDRLDEDRGALSEPLWWQRGTVYQIYPRSFQDSNGDGIGDLEGIRQRLDYLADLGVDAIWISPFFPSPMADFGYDVADYCNIDPMFGDLAAFDRLLADAHGKGLKVILDFVPNHTSDQHAWFQDSVSGRNSAKRDWYIWRDPAPDGGPPNNWLSNFGGSAWEYDEASGQYYYHAFLREQPDLNWRNPEVRAAMNDVLRFWLDRGVDGFRVDVIWHLAKDPDFRDNPVNPGFQSGQPDIERFLQVYSADQPDVLSIIQDMRATLEAYGDRVLIGEIYLPIERLVAYYGSDLSGVHLPFNFQLIMAAWHARGLDQLIADYEQALPAGGWPNWVLGNHDRHRIASRIGSEQARVAAMLLLTLRGTPTIYYGDEIGLEDGTIPPEAVHDPWEKNEPGLGLGRDPERTPMQWTADPKAGFTDGTPWLPLSAGDGINVADQRSDPTSMLALYRRLLALRRSEPALAIGAYEAVAATGDVLAYRRRLGDAAVLVLLNLGHEPVTVEGLGAHRIVLSTNLDRDGDERGEAIALRADEGLVLTPLA